MFTVEKKKKSDELTEAQHLAERGQVNTTAAEVYEDYFVPALFQQWPSLIADAARIHKGQRVLDVACGTGVLARTIASRVGRTGSVSGVDINPGMLAVARRKARHIEWRQARAENLPYEDNQFDAVVSQFGLMFFENRGDAIKEMIRVLKPGGRLVVAVWAAIETSPGYASLYNLIEDLFGEHLADALRAPFLLGEKSELRSLFKYSGATHLLDVQTCSGTARFNSLESWIYTEIKGWALAELISDEQYHQLLQASTQALSSFVDADGKVAFDAPAHVVVAAKHHLS
jgi:SAM-dependent methyltransferase